MPLNKIQVRVQQIRYEAVDIISLLLVDPSGAELPEYSAGAHIDTNLPNGLIRQFSLCGPFSDKHSYLVGVLKEDPGTGGSKFIHENIRAGDLLEISEPKNMFKLNSNAERHLLIGGGIGIAPILSMSYALEQQQAEYTLHYCSRSPEKTAFQKEIADVVQHGQLCFHFDGGIPENGLDIKSPRCPPPDPGPETPGARARPRPGRPPSGRARYRSPGNPPPSRRAPGHGPCPPRRRRSPPRPAGAALIDAQQ